MKAIGLDCAWLRPVLKANHRMGGQRYAQPYDRVQPAHTRNDHSNKEVGAADTSQLLLHADDTRQLRGLKDGRSSGLQVVGRIDQGSYLDGEVGEDNQPHHSSKVDAHKPHASLECSSGVLLAMEDTQRHEKRLHTRAS